MAATAAPTAMQPAMTLAPSVTMGTPAMAMSERRAAFSTCALVEQELHVWNWVK